jgi:outer membrane protein insertion porin family
MTALPMLAAGQQLLAGQQSAADDFIVKDIHIEGLQRISEGTVFNYLPVNIGDHFNAHGSARRCARFTPPAFFVTSSCAATATR